MIAKSEIEHVANLSKLKFNDEEIEDLIEEFSELDKYMEKLQEVDTENVEVTSQVNSNIQFMKEDKIEESFSNEKALLNAPDKQYGYFKLPKILD